MDEHHRSVSVSGGVCGQLIPSTYNLTITKSEAVGCAALKDSNHWREPGYAQSKAYYRMRSSKVGMLRREITTEPFAL